MVISSIPDIAGDNAVHAIGTNIQHARALFLCAVSGPARFGDTTTVGAGRGVSLQTGVTVVIRASEADATDYINLAQVSAYVPSGTTLTIAFGL